MKQTIEVRGASEHNLKAIDLSIERRAITVVTGVSGSGKSSLAFDTVLAEAQRRFFYTLSHYSRQFLDLSSRPAVKGLTGLSPAIALAQNETQPSRRATVGTLTDVSELLAVLCARFGEQRCPEHDQPTGAQSAEEIVARLLAGFDGKTVAIAAPVADAKNGVFK
jgi:excinuclease ABC subunit A